MTFEQIKRYYPSVWNEDHLIMAVEKGFITDVEFEEIVGVSRYHLDTMDNIKTKKQKQNNKALSDFLSSQVIIWTDKCNYGVTKEDQHEMSMIYTQYIMKKKISEDAKLMWHAKHCVNREFEEAEFISLMSTINEFVEPYIAKCQQIKEQIYNATTIDELRAIEIIY